MRLQDDHLSNVYTKMNLSARTRREEDEVTETIAINQKKSGTRARGGNSPKKAALIALAGRPQNSSEKQLNHEGAR